MYDLVDMNAWPILLGCRWQFELFSIFKSKSKTYEFTEMEKHLLLYL